MDDGLRKMKQSFSHGYSYPGIFWGVVLIATVRVLAERFFLLYLHDLPHLFSGLSQGSVRFLLENVYYFLIVFIATTAFVSWIARIRLREVMNFGLRLYPVIILPPLIDGLIFGKQLGYSYATVANFGWNFFTLSFVRGDASPGIAIECLLGVVGMFLYVLWKTRSFWKAALTAVFIDIFVVLISTPEIIFREYADYNFDPFLPLYYFFPFLMLLIALVYMSDKRKVVAGLKNLRPERSLVFVGMVFLGGFAWSAEGFSMNVWNICLAALAAFLVWETSVMINDVYDLGIDSLTNKSRPLVLGVISIPEYKSAAMILSCVALSCAAIIGLKVFLIVLLAVGLAYGYSMRPMRFRNTMWGNVLIGLSVAFSFSVGFLASGREDVLTARMGFLFWLVFLLGTVISLAKDIKDIDGDKQNGVVNLFTLYGEKKAKMLVSGLMFVVLSISAVLFLDPVLLLVNVVSVFFYYRRSSIIVVYLAGMINALVTFRNLYFS